MAKAYQLQLSAWTAPAFAVADDQVRNYELTAQEFDAILRQVRFYLRSSPETDGTTLYRIFHQGLIDELRPLEDRMDEFVDRLLRSAPVEPDGSRRWDAAERYLIRHWQRHAVDAGRLDELLHAEPAELEPHLNTVRTAKGLAAAAIIRDAQHRGGRLLVCRNGATCSRSAPRGTASVHSPPGWPT